MTPSAQPPAWQTPLKDLHLARVMFRKLRADLVAWQKKEYDEETLAFLNIDPPQGKPFPQDFSGEPDNIQQIKNIANALYLAEQAFDKCGNLNIITPTTYDLRLIAEAYEACHLLLNLTAEVEVNFRHEIIALTSGVMSLLSVNRPSASDASVKSFDVGNALGRAIDQNKKSNSTNKDYDLLSYFGAVFPTYPSYIENFRVALEKTVSKNPEHTLNVNQKKMDKLLKQGKKLSDTISRSNQNSLFFVFNLISLIRQTLTLWGEIYQEAGDLNDAWQSLVREHLAFLKYELLPILFRGVDKLEMQLMLKPGRLSKPLMRQIKPWYEALIQRAKTLVTFDEKNEQLLKIEDTRFIELRIKPIQDNIEASEKVLHLIEPGLAALNTYFQNPTKKHHMGLQEHILALTPYMSNTDKTLLSRLNHHLHKEANWTDYARDWYQYITFNSQETTNNPSHENITQTLHQLEGRWKQLTTDHAFKLDRYHKHIDAIKKEAHHALFIYAKNTHIFQISEKQVLESAYLPTKKTIGYVKSGRNTYVQHPEELSTNESWVLYRSYEQKINQLKQAHMDCEHLLKALNDERAPWKDAKILNFPPLYKPALLDKHVLHQPHNIYCKITDGTLEYEVLEPSKKPCKIYLMTLDDAIQAGHQGYIWDHDQNQLSYIAKDGNIQSKIKLSNIGYLKVFLKGQKSNLGKNNELQLNEEVLKNTITSQGHHPGMIHKGSIPLTALGCSLTELKTSDQLKPYLPDIINEAFERGHVQDTFKKNCIRWYSSIQPYLNQHKFDEAITRLFSGSFTTKSQNTPNISLTEARTQWRETQLELSTQIKKLEKKRDLYANQVKHKTFLTHPEPDNNLKHREFSFDTAQFMSSTDPIKRQIHDSKKACFKITLALHHLKMYNPNDLLKEEDYPWFQQMYRGDLSKATSAEINEQFKQIQAYESLQIKHNEQLLKQLNVTSPCEKDATLDEKDAFMYFGHTFEPVVMQPGTQTKPGELQLHLANGYLSYKMMHYGKELGGDIALRLINPPLTEFDESTVIKKDTLTSILNIAYTNRKNQIDTKEDEPSPDEALDLYLWYRANQPNSKKITWFQSLAEKKPHLKLPKKTQKDEEPVKISDHLAGLKSNIFRRFDGYDLVLMSELPNNDEDQAEAGKIYLSSEDGGKYIVRDISGNIQQGTLEGVNLTQLSQTISTPEFKKTILEITSKSGHTLIDLFSTALKQELLIHSDENGPPYPEVGVQNGLTNVLKNLTKLKPIQFVNALSLFRQQTKPDDLTTLENPQQVLFLKRLMNVIYYLEQIAHEIESVNEQEGQIPYVMHLIISFFYTQDIMPLLSGIAKDPVLSATYADILHQVNAISNTLVSESKYYLGASHYAEDNDKSTQTTLHTILNTLKMLPVRLSSSTANFEEKHPELKQAAEKSARNIEAILKHYESSWSYILLILDLPTIQHLLSDMRHDFEAMLEHSHTATLKNLSSLKTKYLARIVLEADKLERNLGLRPGLISLPVNEILDEFYKGLITPLTPEVGQQIKLLCGKSLLLKERQQLATSNQKIAKKNRVHYKKASQTMQTLLDACDDVHNSKHATGYNQLSTVYQNSLPTLKASLNGADTQLLSIQTAKQKDLRDCFVFDEKKSELYHLNAEGELNPQTGCKLYLKSIPDNEDIPKHLEREINMLYPEDSDKSGQKIRVKHPTLVQHKNKYYFYANTDNTGWKYTELNAEIIADMKLDFSRKNPVDIRKKYQDMYDEIATKTKLIYPLHLKNTFKTLRFITKKKESSGNAEKLYLSEHAIKEYITSNSDFYLEKHGVSITPGCCLISLDTAPTDFYELELPAGFGSYYAKIKNNPNVLYYIDTVTSSIQKLPITEGLQTHAGQEIPSELKKLHGTREKNIFDAHDFENITALTGHICDASLMVDINNFTPSVESFDKLQTLAKRAKAYYEGMIKTSELATATTHEQVLFLNQLKNNEKTKNNAIKRNIYTQYFLNKADDLAQKNVDLQGYKLCLLTKNTRLKPNHLYVKIKDHQIHYRVINPAGKTRESFVKLEHINWPQNTSIDSDSIDALTPYLPEILKITSKKGDGHTYPHSLANEYQNKFAEELDAIKTNTINQAVKSGGSKRIDQALLDTKNDFDKNYSQHYKQLNAINQAVNDFHLYLKHEKAHQSNQFELKQAILNHIDNISSDASINVKDRIQAIQEYIQAPGTADTLMAYHTYTSTSLKSLLQCMFRLLEAVGLYTPEMTRRLDKLVDTLQSHEEKPPQANNPWSFFSKTTREAIKEKIVTPKPSDTTPDV